MNTITLEQFSPRGLNLLGSIFGGVDVRVVLSSRAKYPATVVLESRTIVLDPKRTGLYDLALCARLLKHRGLRRAGSHGTHSDRWLTGKFRRQLVPQTQDELRREYPGIGRLPGRYRPDSGLEGLRVVNRSVEWSPLPKLPARQAVTGGPEQPNQTAQRQPGGPWSSPQFEFTKLPELEITGAEDDFAWLLDAIRDGHIPLQTLPELDDLPFVRVPFRFSTGEICPLLEPLEELVSRPDNKEIIQTLMDCYRRKSEVRQQRSNLGWHTRHGVRLDTNRLIEAVLARRTHSRPRIFRQPGTTIEPVFDPREHLVVIAFDLNDLQRREDWRDDDRREATQRFLACMITVYQQLEVDCVVIGFADQLLALPDGRHFCLHLAMTVKRIEDDIDGAFWNRMGHLLARPLRFPGVPTCFHPLSLRDITRCFDEVVRDQEHSYRGFVYWARRGMHRDFPQFRTTDFLMRTADHVDAQVQDAERRFTGTLDTLISFLPAELKIHGRPGQYLRQIEIP
jgi:hypothetical protein